MHIRDLKRGDSTDVCARRRADGMVETAIITVAPKDLTFIHTIRRSGEGGQSWSGSFPVLYGAPFLTGSQQAALFGSRLAAQQEAGMAVQMAKLQAMTPALQARLQTLGPELEARLAERRARMEANGGVRLRSLQPTLPTALAPPPLTTFPPAAAQPE